MIFNQNHKYYETLLFKFAVRCSLFAMSIGLLFLVTGCEKEEIQGDVLENERVFSPHQFTPEKIDEVITEKNFRQFINSKPKVVIEYTTPEEMNAILVKNGLDPIPQAEVDEYYERKRQGTLRAQFPDECHTANLIAELGDVSGNGSLSTYDVVLAQWIVNAWLDDQNMCAVQNAMILQDFKVGKMSSISPWYRNIDDLTGVEFNHVEDPESIRRVLLGFDCCG